MKKADTKRLIISILSIVVIFAISSISFVKTTISTTNACNESLTTKSKAASSSVSNVIDYYLSSLVSISSSISSKNDIGITNENCIINSNSELKIYLENGNILTNSDISKNAISKDEYTTLLNELKTNNFLIKENRSDSTDYVEMFVPIYKNNSIVGILSATISSAEIAKKTVLENNNFLAVNLKTNRVLFSSGLNDNTLKSIISNSDFINIVNNKDNTNHSFSISVPQNEKIVYSDFLSDYDIVVFTVTDKSDAFSNLQFVNKLFHLLFVFELCVLALYLNSIRKLNKRHNIEKDQLVSNVAKSEYELKNAKSEEILAKFSSKYATTYLVNISEDYITALNIANGDAVSFGSNKKYTDFIKDFIDTKVYHADRQLMATETSIHNLTQKTKNENSFSCEFRETSGVVPRWYKMTATGFNDKSLVMIAFEDKNREISLNHISKSVISNFDVVFSANIIDNTILVVKSSTSLEQFQIRAGKTVPYVDTIKLISEKISKEEYSDFWEKLTSKETITKIFANQDNCEYTFKTQNNIWIRCNIDILERNDINEAMCLVFRFVRIDRVQSKNLDFVKNINLLMNISDGFLALYDVDPATDSYVSLSANNTYEISIDNDSEKDNFFQKVISDIQNTVYSEDREIVSQYLSKDYMTSTLAAENDYSIEYRTDVDSNIKWKCVRIARYDETGHILVGVFDINEEIINREKKNQALNHYSSIIDTLSETYDYICSINTETNECERVHESDKFLKITKDYDQSIPLNYRLDRLFNEIIIKEDIEKFRLSTDRNSLTKEIIEKGTAVVKFRALLEGEILWYAIKFVYTEIQEKKNVIMGIYSINEDALKEAELVAAHTFSNLIISSYISAYYIDLVENKYTVFTRQQDLKDSYDETTEYWPSFLSYIEKDVFEEDKELLKEIANPQNLLERIKTQDEFSHIFRDIRSGLPRYYKMQIIRSSDSRHIAMCFLDIEDEIQKQKSDIERENRLKEFQKVLISSSSGYLEANLSKNTVVGDIIDIGANGEQIKVSVPDLDKNAGYDEFVDWWANNELISNPEEFINSASSTALIDSFNKGKSVVDILCSSKYANGSTKYLQTTFYLYKDSYTNDIVTLCLNSDITSSIKDKQNLENYAIALEDAKEKAESANKAKSTFLFSMSHDIRTPMNAITGYTAMAKKYQNDTEKVVDCLEKIDISGHQLLTLVNQVLEMSRIESGKIVLQDSETDIIEFANALMTISSSNAKARGIETECKINNVSERVVLIDSDRIHQIMLNVIGNAIKYTMEGGHITFTIEQKPYDKPGYGLYVMSVKDTGIGMAPEFIPRIFDEFSREESSTISHIQGTGLGMSIVKKLTDILGGTIDITSNKGVGTEITISIPMKQIIAEENDKSDEIVSIESQGFTGKRVLLVEDNEMNREIATDILEDEGIIVDQAEDGDIAVDKVKNSAPGYYDLVLMDIQMPRMNGYEATAEIRKLENNELASIPIIALSANAFEEDRRKSIESGMNDHLAKPIVVNKLFETIAKYM